MGARDNLLKKLLPFGLSEFLGIIETIWNVVVVKNDCGCHHRTSPGTAACFIDTTKQPVKRCRVPALQRKIRAVGEAKVEKRETV